MKWEKNTKATKQIISWTTKKEKIKANNKNDIYYKQIICVSFLAFKGAYLDFWYTSIEREIISIPSP